jgi:hypothetical protein
MTIMGLVRPAAVLALVVALAACAERAGGTPLPPTDAAPSPTAALPKDGDALVLRVEHVGGFVPPEQTAGRLPLTSVYADGRVIVEGPVAAIYPGFAWPNVQVVDIGRDAVQELADRALADGVAETDDLGMPPLADAPSTRFTLVTASGSHVREVNALTETTGMTGTGLTDAQLAARQKLAGLFTALTDLAVTDAGQEPPQSFTPAAVAGIVRPWTPSEEDVAAGLTPEAVAWPGPALPGEPIGALPDLTCVTATGDDATAVIEAARKANTLTPWLSPDGSRWSVLFRPLLPDESGCSDLLD